MGIVVYFLDSVLANYINGSNIKELIALLISAGAGVLVYSVLIYLLKIDEVDWIIKVVRDKLNKVKARA